MTLPVLALVWRADRARSLRRHLPALAAGSFALTLATGAAKDHFAAERPLQRFEARIRSGEVEVRDPAGEALRQRSFPSGHAAVSCFLLGYLCLVDRRQPVWALPLAERIGCRLSGRRAPDTSGRSPPG